MKSSRIISTIVPVYNEAANIDKLIQRLLSSLGGITSSFEILLINDGSTDATLQKIKELVGQHPCVLYLSFSRNFGHQIAVSVGSDRLDWVSPNVRGV